MYSLLIYGFLVLFLFVNSSIVSRSKQRTIHYRGLLFAFIIISIFLGGRYNVGTDWANYKDYYDDISANGITWGNIEPFYLLLNQIVSITGFSSSFFFFCISIIQLSIVYFVFKDDKRIFALGMLVYFLCCLPISLNIVRQSLAICIFLYAVKYIGNSPLKYISLIAIAGLFHYSSFILLGVYFLNYKLFSFLDNRKLSVILYILSVFGGAVLLGPILSLAPIDLLGYKYSNNLNNADLEMTVNSGIGMIVNHILNVIILWYLPNLKSAISEKINYLTVVSRAYIFGIILANVFGVSVFLSRLPLPLVMLKVILVPYIYYYLTRSKNLHKTFIAYGLIFSYILLFVVSVLNGAGGISPYSFKWL